MSLKIGTKSVLYGAHCFIIHPFFVAAAWMLLYGFPKHPAIWLSFFFHDIGYWGKPNMDGEEGEKHVETGAKVLEFLFGKKWGDFSRYHSRYYAKKDGVSYSKLCVADKLAIALEPHWLYLPRVRWTGEIHEYMHRAKNNDGKYNSMEISTENQEKWFSDVKDYLYSWVEEHKEIKEDKWTPDYDRK